MGARRGRANDLSRSSGRAAGGLASYRRYQRETSLEMRQVFKAGLDDEQVEAPTFLQGGRYA